MRTLLKGILLVLVSFTALLLPIAPATAHKNSDEMQLRFLVGTGLLCPLAANACPDVSKAANGDTIHFAGQGTISVGEDSDDDGGASGHGTFIHMNAEGGIIARGTWKARTLISFTPYGSGSVQGLPANFQGGLAIIGITARPEGTRGVVLHATLAIDCTLGHAPLTAHEGITLTVPNLITFDQKVSGFTLFISTDD